MAGAYTARAEEPALDPTVYPISFRATVNYFAGTQVAHPSANARAFMGIYRRLPGEGYDDWEDGTNQSIIHLSNIGPPPEWVPATAGSSAYEEWARSWIVTGDRTSTMVWTPVAGYEYDIYVQVRVSRHDIVSDVAIQTIQNENVVYERSRRLIAGTAGASYSYDPSGDLKDAVWCTVDGDTGIIIVVNP